MHPCGCATGAPRGCCCDAAAAEDPGALFRVSLGGRLRRGLPRNRRVAAVCGVCGCHRGAAGGRGGARERRGRAVDACASQGVDPTGLSDNEKKAFFINLYNALVIHATVVLGVPRTSAGRGAFFSTSSYAVGGATYSLDDIEHGVLRGNRRGPYALRRCALQCSAGCFLCDLLCCAFL